MSASKPADTKPIRKWPPSCEPYCVQESAGSNSMQKLFHRNLQMGLSIGWQHNCQPIISHIWKKKNHMPDLIKHFNLHGSNIAFAQYYSSQGLSLQYKDPYCSLWGCILRVFIAVRQPLNGLPHIARERFFMSTLFACIPSSGCCYRVWKYRIERSDRKLVIAPNIQRN